MNFEFYNPTKVLFGKGNLEKLGEVVKDLVIKLY